MQLCCYTCTLAYIIRISVKLAGKVSSHKNEQLTIESLEYLSMYTNRSTIKQGTLEVLFPV